MDKKKSILFLSLTLLNHLILFVSATNEAGLAFLDANAKKEGVIVLPSGLQYKVLQKGNGMHHPKVGTQCSCHYAGTLIDGSEFDSSYGRGSPSTFAPSGVIRGWTEAMQLMVEGDKWELYIPSELAYGERGSSPKIGPAEALIFTIEMIDILGDKQLACSVESLMGEQNGATESGCSEKVVAFVKKMKQKHGGLDGFQKEVGRVNKLRKEAKVKKELFDWMETRIYILDKMVEYEIEHNSQEL